MPENTATWAKQQLPTYSPTPSIPSRAPAATGLGGSISGNPQTYAGGQGANIRRNIFSRAPGAPGGGGQPIRTTMDTPAAINPALQGGVVPGTNMMGGPAYGGNFGAPTIDEIRAEMARRQVGQQLGPNNAALSGYLMGQ